MSKQRLPFVKHSAKIPMLDGTQAYAQLKQQVTQAGILKRQYPYYTVLILFCFTGIAISLYEIITHTYWAALILWGVIFSFFSVQVGGLMHDAGHRAIFKSAKINDIFGQIFGAYLSMGYSSWKYRHNTHHAHPNDIHDDPDVFTFPMLSFSPEFLKKNTGILRYINKFQVVFYYPLILLFNIGMRIYAIGYFRKKTRQHLLEIAVYTLGLFIWFVLPFMVFDLYKAVILVLVINVAMGFYLMNIFASNHKPMPLIAKDAKPSFLEQQVMTSCNVNPGWVTDFVFLGLNYQIEHHLFPNCPRNKLKYITPYVQDICKKLKLEYTKVSVIEVNKMILTRLHEISKTLEV